MAGHDEGIHGNNLPQHCSRAAQSYGAYVLHLVILLSLQYTFDKVWMGNVGKFLFLGTLTCFLSFGLAWLLRIY